MQAVDARLARLFESTSYSGLRLLVAFGSRARGDAGPRADGDFGYVAGPEFDPDQLLADAPQGYAGAFHRAPS